MATRLCVFEYRYRDAANYKQHEDVLLSGDFDPSDVEVIERSVGQDGWFIPEQVGLASLQHRFGEFGAVPDAHDHVWHEFIALRAADDDDCARLPPNGSKSDLIMAFRKVRNWDEARSPIRNRCSTASNATFHHMRMRSKPLSMINRVCAKCRKSSLNPRQPCFHNRQMNRSTSSAWRESSILRHAMSEIAVLGRLVKNASMSLNAYGSKGRTGTIWHQRYAGYRKKMATGWVTISLRSRPMDANVSSK